MPNLEINGRRIEVDESFLSLSPQEQDAAVNEIAAELQTTASHPAFDGSHIPGYNAETGLVEHRKEPSRTTTAVTSTIEGLPVAGAPLAEGAEAISAGIGSLLSGEPYSKVRGEIDEQVERGNELYPNTRFAGNLAGAIGGTVPMVMAAPTAFGVRGGGLISRSLASGATGTTLGSADSAVRSEGDLDAIRKGALWGSALGLAGPGLGHIAGKGARYVADKFRKAPSAAQSLFSRAVGSDAVDDIPAHLSKLGDDALPMDLGPNLQSQAGALAATPGRGQEIVRDAIASRQAGSGARITSALDDALGGSIDTVAMAGDIIAKRSAAAKPLYDAAYAKPVPYSRQLSELLKRPALKRALKKAQRLAADEGVSSKQWFANVADDGTVSISNTPDVRQLDLTKRALDDMISAAQRAGNNNEARILIQQKDLLTGIVDKAVPEYASARAAFSGPSAVKDALGEGGKVFSNNLTPNQLRTSLQKMGAAEQEAFIQGARAKVSQIMGTARNDALAARTMFQKGFNAEKLELLVGKEQAAKLMQTLDAETTFAQTSNTVSGNSETARRALAQSEISGKSDRVGTLHSLLNMRGGDAVTNLGDRMLGGVRSAAQSKQNEELAKLLTSRDPRMLSEAIKMVQAAQRRGDITMQRSKEIVNSLMIGTAVQAGP